jgi:Family of unknown function (DUF6527)
MRFPNWVRQFWAWVHRVPKPDFTTERVTIHPAPDRIKPGQIVVVGDRQIQKWACFQCPGGCGEVIKLSLNQHRRPCWSIQVDRFDRPTISPSIRQINDCRCHFWIKEGQVEWCNDSGRVVRE